jgi:hypothetical protein
MKERERARRGEELWFSSTRDVDTSIVDLHRER